MLKKINSWNIFLKGFLLSALTSFTIYLLMIPMLFFNLGEYPHGLLLGEFISYTFMFIIGLLSNKLKKTNTVIIIVILFSRLFILGGLMYLIGWMYYSQNIHIFNLFTVTGGYFIPLLIVLILASIERRKEKKNV